MAAAHARAKKLFIRAIKSAVIEWNKGLIFHVQVLAVGMDQLRLLKEGHHCFGVGSPLFMRSVAWDARGLIRRVASCPAFPTGGSCMAFSLKKRRPIRLKHQVPRADVSAHGDGFDLDMPFLCCGLLHLQAPAN